MLLVKGEDSLDLKLDLTNPQTLRELFTSIQ